MTIYFVLTIGGILALLPYIGMGLSAVAGAIGLGISISEANKGDERYAESMRQYEESQRQYRDMLTKNEKSEAENKKLNDEILRSQALEAKKYTASGQIQHMGSDRR